MAAAGKSSSSLHIEQCDFTKLILSKIYEPKNLYKTYIKF